jgi:hypothetical protein
MKKRMSSLVLAACWLKLFWCTFYRDQILIFEIDMKDRFFMKKKKLYLSRDNEYFLRTLKVEKLFLQKVLRYSSPFQKLMPDIWASKSLVPNVYVYFNCSRGGRVNCGCVSVHWVMC